ncbi:MAG: hypothetical protein K9K76_08250 [Halanaerobiales bacterium]|nr:hypothetical protein [Halanaerobiales bacterium]
MASFLIDLPIGSFLFLRTNKNRYSNKEICFKDRKLNVDRENEFRYLLDGQQRISVLKSIFSKLILDNKERFIHIYPGLRYLWFLKIKPYENDEDIFGFNELKFEENNLKKLVPEDIIDYIEMKRVYKTKDHWYNLLSTSVTRNSFVKKCTDKYMIPLFSVAESGRGYHVEVLSRIKNDLIEMYKNFLMDDNENETLVDWDLITNKMIEEGYIENTSDKEQLIHNVDDYIAEKFIWKIRTYLEKILDKNVNNDEKDQDDLPRAISIFEHINLGGQHLDTFDIIVAKACNSDTFSENNLVSKLRSNLKKVIEIPVFIENKYDDPVFTNDNEKNNTYTLFIRYKAITDKMRLNNPIIKEQFLKLLSLLNNNGENHIEGDILKSKGILKLSAQQIVDNWEIAIKGLKRACIFFIEKCGIYNIKQVPYNLMFLPIAYILCEDTNWNNKEVWNKLEYWYWYAIFGGFYSSNQSSRNVIDIRNLKSTINGEEDFKNKYDRVTKDDLFNKPFYNDKDTLELKNAKTEMYPSKNVKNAILQFILSQKPKDFEKEDNLSAFNVLFGKYKIEKHHIIPVSRFENEDDEKVNIKYISKDIRGDKNNALNSPLNITYILTETNNNILNKKPSDYFADYFKKDDYFEVTKSHFIPEFIRSIDSIDEDEINNFLEERFKKISESIKTYLQNLYDNISN